MAYEIIIKNATDGADKNSAVAGDKSSGSKTDKKELSPAQKNTAKGLVVWNKVKPFVTQIAGNKISQVSLKTGSRELQEKIEFTYGIVNAGVGIAESALTGYAIGNIPGAIVGTLFSAFHQTITIAQRTAAINTQRSIENVSIQMNYIRAGARGSRNV